MSDLISRQAAIDSFTEIILNLKNVYGDMGSAVNGARECIKSLPSAEPERKKGKWIKHENQTLGHCMKIIYECSVCHIAVGCEYFVRRSFCPNCGADMRGEDGKA